ncbi:MAG: hypothetical protein DI536_30600 [Archangium gephyra]|uniref:Lipoprotein n=1 Tax=Archangium gephyra TaxID=48 RepID=A0A2W5T2R9_9BACT|nr:MAG: hypothetical protein DI536_30600 [Archangium gephyra]
MRVALLAVALSGCLAPMQFDSLAARANVNELEAQQYAQGRQVLVRGLVEDITSLRSQRVRFQTTEQTQRITHGVRRRTVEHQPLVENESLPYAKLTVADGSSVYCFMPLSTAVLLTKGSRVSLAGFVDGFFREENGTRSASLYDCFKVD